MSNLKFTARLQSFLIEPELYWNKDKQHFTTIDCIERMAATDGITHVEPNYPMHFRNHSVNEIKECVEKLGLAVSGVALRYDDDEQFRDGEMTASNPQVRRRALDLMHEAADICRQLGGTTITVWSAYDGFDYSFQVEYADAWDALIAGVSEVAKAHPDMKISIEYKPYEPRPFYLINDIGTTLLAIHDIGYQNVGVTLDFAHMLMKKEQPAYALTLAAERGRLFGVHLNDGYGSHDDQLVTGSVNLMQTLELVYYMRKYNYQDVVFFDTSPVREDPVKECETNIAVFTAMWEFIERIGDDHVAALINTGDATTIQQRLLCERLLNM